MEQSSQIEKILCAGITLFCLTGCISIPPPESSEVAELEEVEEAKLLLHQQQPQKALDILEKSDQNEEVFYLMGCASILRGDVEGGIAFYQKTLDLRPDHHAAYLALNNIYQWEQFNLHAQIEDLKEKEICAREEGKGGLTEIHESLLECYHQKAQMFLSQARTYLLYSDIASNIASFADLDAHLRDMQDFFEEKHRVPPEFKGLKEEDKYESLVREIEESRQAITKKYARTLFQRAVNLTTQGNVAKAVAALKEADDHISKFFAPERPTGKVSALKSEEDVLALAQEIVSHLGRYYEEFLKITLENKAQFIAMGNWQAVEDETHQIEEILQSWIQLNVNALWRFEKIPREAAEEHPRVAPLYEQFLLYLPNSSKAGQYHYKLARFYYNQGDMVKAKIHAYEAEQRISDYTLERFLEQLEGKDLKETERHDLWEEDE